MQIRKSPIRGGEDPGFVVNRVLNLGCFGDLAPPGTSPAVSPEEIDKEIAEAKVTPWARSISPTCGAGHGAHVAEHLQASYGDRFYVHPQMKELVEAGKLGCRPVRATTPTEAEWRRQPQMTVVDRFQLKAFAEAVLVVDEGSRRP